MCSAWAGREDGQEGDGEDPDLFCSVFAGCVCVAGCGTEGRLLSWPYDPIWPVFYLMAKVRSTRERHSFMCIDFN